MKLLDQALALVNPDTGQLKAKAIQTWDATKVPIAVVIAAHILNGELGADDLLAPLDWLRDLLVSSDDVA